MNLQNTLKYLIFFIIGVIINYFTTYIDKFNIGAIKGKWIYDPDAPREKWTRYIWSTINDATQFNLNPGQYELVDNYDNPEIGLVPAPEGAIGFDVGGENLGINRLEQELQQQIRDYNTDPSNIDINLPSDINTISCSDFIDVGVDTGSDGTRISDEDYNLSISEGIPPENCKEYLGYHESFDDASDSAIRECILNCERRLLSGLIIEGPTECAASLKYRQIRNYLGDDIWAMIYENMGTIRATIESSFKSYYLQSQKHIIRGILNSFAGPGQRRLNKGVSPADGIGLLEYVDYQFRLTDITNTETQILYTFYLLIRQVFNRLNVSFDTISDYLYDFMARYIYRYMVNKGNEIDYKGYPGTITEYFNELTNGFEEYIVPFLVSFVLNYMTDKTAQNIEDMRESTFVQNDNFYNLRRAIDLRNRRIGDRPISDILKININIFRSNPRTEHTHSRYMYQLIILLKKLNILNKNTIIRIYSNDNLLNNIFNDFNDYLRYYQLNIVREGAPNLILGMTRSAQRMLESLVWFGSVSLNDPQGVMEAQVFGDLRINTLLISLNEIFALDNDAILPIIMEFIQMMFN